MLHYDHISLSPDGKILAATHGSTLQWLCAETGQVLDTAEKAHDGKTCFLVSLKYVFFFSLLCMVLLQVSRDVIWVSRKSGKINDGLSHCPLYDKEMEVAKLMRFVLGV